MKGKSEKSSSAKLLKTNFDIISVFLEYTDWYQALGKVFSLVGSHVSVDRIYYFEIHTDPATGQELTSQRFEWVKNGIEPMIDNPDLQNLPIEFAEDFMKPLHQNMAFESIIRELPDGNTKDILSSQSILSILVLPINIQNRIYGFIGFDDCTSERKWGEEEMHFLQSITSNLSSAIYRRNALLEAKNKAVELEKINQELEQFAYVASHDLQEPLRMVTGFLELFERKYMPIIDEQGKKYIHYAVDGATRMKRIINDLLEYSRIGKSDNILEDILLEGLCTELQHLFKSKIEEKQAEFVFSGPDHIYTWRAPLQQVLINLLDNSLKYSTPGVSPKISLNVTQSEKQLTFEFADNGIGIDYNYFDKIFVIFQRLHTKDEYEGSGVGLAIVKKTIENLGGKIWLNSKLGLGTTFNFTLPIQNKV